MNLTLTRCNFGPDFTIGKLEIPLMDNIGIDRIARFFTLEDKVRGDGDPKTVGQWKVKHESAIPYGTYKLRYTWSPARKENCWRLFDVPGFDGILIHSGNTKKDTSGCILLGLSVGDGMIYDSKKAMASLTQLLPQTEEHTIEITK